MSHTNLTGSSHRDNPVPSHMLTQLHLPLH